MSERLPQADPYVPADYRHALGKVPTSVAVISSMTGPTPVGVSVGSFSSISLQPPLVGFFIASASTTWPSIEPTGGFCASILSKEHEVLCRVFATKGADKFAGRTWLTAPSGRPIIDGAVAWFDCSIQSTVPLGDHALVVGLVDAMGAVDEDPLVFLGGRYGRVAELGRKDNDWEA